MRYDDADPDRTPEYTFDVPPNDRSDWLRDELSVLIDLMALPIQRAIERRAYADPETYCFDLEERERRVQEFA